MLGGSVVKVNAYFTEGAGYAVLALIYQGLGAYMYDQGEYSKLIAFFAGISLSRNVASSILLEPMLGYLSRNESVGSYLSNNFIFSVIISFVLYLVFFSNDFIIYFILITAFLLDTYFQFMRRLFLINGKIRLLPLVYLVVGAVFLLSSYAWASDDSSWYIINFLCATLTGCIISTMCAVREGILGLNFGLPNLSTYKFRDILFTRRVIFSLVINQIHFVAGNAYIFWYQYIGDNTNLALTKLFSLYQAPLFMLSGAIANRLIGDDKWSIPKSKALVSVILVLSVVLCAVGFVALPDGLLSSSNNKDILLICISMIFFGFANSLFGIVIAPFRKKGAHETIFLVILPGLLILGMVVPLTYESSSFFHPMLVSATMYMFGLCAAYVGLSRTNDISK